MWHTWIDYNKFDILIDIYYKTVDNIRKQMVSELGEEELALQLELNGGNNKQEVLRMNKTLMDSTTNNKSKINTNIKSNPKSKLNKFEILLTDAANAFCATDYMVETPTWALYNSEERGFDPSENRFRRNKHGVIVENEYRPSGSGCG